MMNIFDWIVLLGAICGFVMVAGSMFLLWKGAITLHEASVRGALDVQVSNSIKISTSYPALALFVIGLIFVLSCAYLAQQGTVRDLKIIGKLIAETPSEIRDADIELFAGPWPVFHRDGAIDYSVLPSRRTFMVEIKTPSSEKRIPVNLEGSKIILGEIKVGREVIVRQVDIDFRVPNIIEEEKRPGIIEMENQKTFYIDDMKKILQADNDFKLVPDLRQ